MSATVPADVRAAAEAYVITLQGDALVNGLKPAVAALVVDMAITPMTAALAVADAVRIADAGALVGRLVAFVDEGLFAMPTIVADAQDAATLITTLRARLTAVEAERDTARADALREAAEVARRVEIGVEMYGRTAQALACAAAILALIPEGGA